MKGKKQPKKHNDESPPGIVTSTLHDFARRIDTHQQRLDAVEQSVGRAPELLARMKKAEEDITQCARLIYDTAGHADGLAALMQKMPAFTPSIVERHGETTKCGSAREEYLERQCSHLERLCEWYEEELRDAHDQS